MTPTATRYSSISTSKLGSDGGGHRSLNPLLWANILSLDAPVVALVWQAFFASRLGVDLTPVAHFVLGASVWLVYSGDRILDGIRIEHTALPRHRFAKLYRRPLILIWGAILFATVTVAWSALPRPSFYHGLWLLVFVAVYFVLVQGPGRFGWIKALKEVSAGILFGLGSVVLLFPDGTVLSSELWLPLGLWCCLCILNCVAIACWEFEWDRREKQESVFTFWPVLRRYLITGTVGLAVVAFALLMLEPSSWKLVYGAIAMSSLIIMLLHRVSDRLGIDGLRVSADLALLTPLFFVLWAGVR